DVSTFIGDAAAGTVHKRLGEAGVNYGIAIATSTERTRRVTFGLLEHQANYSSVPGVNPGPMPGHEQLAFLQVSADWEELDFLTVRRIQKFTHDEDYNLGLSVIPSVAWAPYLRPLSDTQSQIVPSIVVRKG